MHDEKKTGDELTFQTGLKHGIPIMLGYLSVSFTFGMMASSAGFPIWAAVLISMTNLTSAGQFAGLAILVSGGGFIEMGVAQAVINLRYALMSISLSQKVDETVTVPHRLLLSVEITDEIFAVSCSQKQSAGKRYLYGIILLPYIGWAAGTLLGAAASGFLPASVCAALGIAIYGMFLAILLPPVKKQKGVLAVVILAVALSCLLTYAPVLSDIPGGFRIILCSVGAALLGAFVFPRKEEDHAAE